MLQRQIIYKQLQELQRRQQQQELSGSGNLSYVNHLLPLEQGGQFPHAVNGTPLYDSSQIFMANNMQMMPNESLLPQSQNHSSGNNVFTQPQFGLSSYGTAPVFQEKNFFGQVPIQSFDHEISSENYSQPNSASLDPLEQKILYNTGDKTWESSFNNIESRGFENLGDNTSYMDELPSTQSGSWSALMLSAVAETSSSDTGNIQEDWSDSIFQNQEPSNFSNNQKQKSNWADLNFRNPPSTGSKPDLTYQDLNVNCTFPGFQQSGHQSSSPLPSLWPSQHKEHLKNDVHGKDPNFSGHESKDTGWLHGSAPRGIQKPFDQVNVPRYSTELGETTSGTNGENMLDLFNKDNSIIDQTPGNQFNAKISSSKELSLNETSVESFAKPCNISPQSYPFFPSLSMGNSSSISPSMHNMNKQDSPLTKSQKFSSNFSQPLNSVSSNLEISSHAINEQPNQNTFEQNFDVQDLDGPSRNFLQESPAEISRYSHDQESSRKHHLEEYSAASGSPHQFHSPKIDQTDSGSKFPINYNGVIDQQAIDGVPQFGPFSSVDNKERDLQETKREMYGQIDDRSRFICSNDDSNAIYQSQTSLQTPPSLYKHYGSLKNGQLPTYDPKAAINTVQELSGVNLEKSTWSSNDPPLIMSRQVSPPNMLPSGVIDQNLTVSLPKKRKTVAFDTVPWHKEINRVSPRLPNISTAELEWAQASNRRHEEVKSGTEIIGNLIPTVRSKRRLVFTTQLMQQIFHPAPAVILSADVHSNCESLAYFSARLELADACSMSLDKICDFSKVVEGLISRGKKLEDDLLRMGNSLSNMDIRLETRELEKFSIVNRFAKLHMKAQSNSLIPGSSFTVQNSRLQRYVIALPMPSTVPEGADCYPL